MAETHAVALKLPTFWTDKPDLWFCSVEAQFAIRNITQDETKYYYVVSALTNDMASAVSSVLTNPPAKDKYVTLKTALEKFYRVPPIKKVTNFIHQGTISDRRPREVAKELFGLGATAEQFQMALFVNAMPTTVQTHLLARDYKDVSEMADTAEALVSEGLVGVSAATKPRPAAGKPKRELCFYHRNFGDRARRCQPPCRLNHTFRVNQISDDNQENFQLFR